MTIQSISSRDNPLYKQLKRLAASAQIQRKANQAVLDGVHLCDAYLQQVGLPVFCVVSEAFSTHHEVAPLFARCSSATVQCILLPDALFQGLSQLEHGVGLLFVIDLPAQAMPAALTQSAVLLDRLQDPGNLGSILRSAAAAGIDMVFCSPGTAFAWSPKVLRAGMGAHFVLKIFENVALAPLIQASTAPVLATSSHATKRLYDLDLHRSVAWLFGHEGQGVERSLLALASHQVAIPHLGEVESLNVAASAAVCFFEQVRQKMACAA